MRSLPLTHSSRRSADADYAYRKLHGILLHGRELKVEFAILLHGRELKVEFATRSDFKFFGWKW